MKLKRNDNNDKDNNSTIINIDVEIKFALTFLGRFLITIYFKDYFFYIISFFNI